MRKRTNIKKAVQIFSVILLVRDLYIFYKKNRRTIQMAVKAGQKFIERRKRKAGR